MYAQRSSKNMLVQVAPWLFVLLWSTGFIAAKYTSQHAPPFKLLFLRGVCSCVVFLSISVAMRMKFPSINGMWIQFKVGLLLQAVFLGGCFFAISRGMPSGAVALVTGLQPLLTAIYVSSRQRKQLSLTTWLGIAIGFTGVFLVLSPSSHALNFSAYAFTGALFGLLGVTAGTILQHQVKMDGHVLTSTLFQYVALTLFAGFAAYFTETQSVVWSSEFTFGLLWLVIGVSTAAMLLLLFMLQRGEATTIATYFYLVPVCTSFLAWFIFKEPFSSIILIGMAVTVVGMLMVLKRPAVPS